MTRYNEISAQVFNLVDNNKDKVNDFYSSFNVSDTEKKKLINNWFNSNVKEQELNDLFNSDETKTGLIDWICSSDGNEFFNNSPQEINHQNVNQIDTDIDLTSDNTQIHKDIEDEDDEIMTPSEKRIKKDMSDGTYDSNNIDNDNEIDIALDLMDDGSDDGVDIVFDIIDGSDEEFEVMISNEDDGSDEEPEDEEIHKKRIHLDHHINKVVESIDDEEEIDRFVHKKYYVMKKPELGSTERLNELEDELDKENISYYDFGKNETIAIKIYCQNEVKVNRLLEKLNFECRCVDIAHYTDNWNS